MRNSRISVRLVASLSGLLVAAGTLAACGSASPKTASSSTTAGKSSTASSTTKSGASPAGPSTSLLVGTLPVVDNVVIWLAVKNGYFSQRGLDVTYKNISGGGAAVAKALQSGSVQFAQFSSTVFVLATSHGAPVTSVAEMDVFPTNRSPEGIFVKSSSPIKTVAQLKGATIGVNTLSSLEVARLKAEVLPAAHLTASDVHLVPIPFAQMQEALSTGEVQAVIPFDPFTTKLRRSSKFRQLTNLTQYLPSGGLILGVITAKSSYAKAHPQVTKKFQAAIAQSISYIDANPKKAAAVASQVLGIPTSLTLAGLHDVQLIPGGKQELATYQNMVKLLQKVKLVPSNYSVGSYLTK